MPYAYGISVIFNLPVLCCTRQKTKTGPHAISHRPLRKQKHTVNMEYCKKNIAEQHENNELKCLRDC